MSKRPGRQLTTIACVAAVLLCSGRLAAELHVSPSRVVLHGPEASQQILVTSLLPDGNKVDVTRQVTYLATEPGVTTIDDRGLVRPLREGRAEIAIRLGQEQHLLAVEVGGLNDPEPVSFQHEVLPILTKAGCNSGSCHGKAEGKNGFKLSVFASDPAADYDALCKESRGRRIFLADADQSLLLRKAAALVPHGGGARIEQGSLHYQRLRRWVAEGGRWQQDERRRVVAIEVEPRQQVLGAEGRQQLRVTAIDTGGQRRCVTVEAEYKSNADTIANVSERGLIQAGVVPGEAAILVCYMGQVDVCRITHPRKGVNFARPPEVNFIDRLVWDKLQRLGIVPSKLADDATFMRRVYLDTIGTLPTVREADEFLASTDRDKRARLIDKLLDHGEYADYWAMRWADILRVDAGKVGPQAAAAMTLWLRRQLAENRPYDEFVREIVTAHGNVRAEGPASLYTALDKPDEISRSISQLFLGVRIECAQCHHHPSEKWGQDDYYALAGFFTGLKRKNIPTGGEAILARGGTDMVNPRTGKSVASRALGAAPADFSTVSDRRIVLADWMTHEKNPFFAKAIANRLWAHYFARGLVEPLDDLRATNPATNEPLLDALAAHLREQNHDIKAFTRTLLNSRSYQLSSKTNQWNADDQQCFSHAAHKPLPAEVLLDAISQASGAPEKFEGRALGWRAIQIWDSRTPSAFLRIFGRPPRATVCACERSSEPSITQAAHLINSPEIMAKIQSPGGRARRLANSNKTPRRIIEELYLATLSRPPSAREREYLLGEYGKIDRRTATEDVLWVLINSKEFLFNH